MYYAQLLRLRGAFIWYAAITGAVFLIALTIIDSHVHGDLSGIKGTFPLSSVLLAASFLAIIFGTVCGRSLNQDNGNVEMVWTKPIARERLAVAYMLLDITAIVAAYLWGLVLIVIIIASIGALQYVSVDASSVPTALLGLGAALMWNGELQALTAGRIGGGGLMVGLSWAAFAWLLPICTALSALWGPAVHSFFVALNYLNPLSYLATSNGGHVHIGEGTSGVQQSFIPLSDWTRAAITWALGLAGWAVAIFAWKRLEV